MTTPDDGGLEGDGKGAFWLFAGIGIAAFLVCIGIGGCTYLISAAEARYVYVTNSFNTLPK